MAAFLTESTASRSFAFEFFFFPFFKMGMAGSATLLIFCGSQTQRQAAARAWKECRVACEVAFLLASETARSSTLFRLSSRFKGSMASSISLLCCFPESTESRPRALHSVLPIPPVAPLSAPAEFGHGVKARYWDSKPLSP